MNGVLDGQLKLTQSKILIFHLTQSIHPSISALFCSVQVQPRTPPCNSVMFSVKIALFTSVLFPVDQSKKMKKKIARDQREQKGKKETFELWRVPWASEAAALIRRPPEATRRRRGAGELRR